MITSAELAQKYRRIGYNVVALSYWVGESLPMTIHLEKVV
nr:MAG TPA: hypothetical protein [Caudoviricetes sp.]